MTPVGVLVALGAAAYEPEVIARLPRGSVHVARRCVDVTDLLAAAASRRGDIALVSSHLGGLDAAVVDRLARDGVGVVGVVAEAASADEALLRRIGVARIAPADDLGALVALLLDASQPATAEPDEPSEPATTRPSPGESGIVLAVWGPTGAPGRTTVALGLASALASLSVATLVVDADVYGGTLAQAMGMLDESSGLLAAARAANVGALDVAALAEHARQLGPGLRALTGLPRADRWIEASPALVRQVLDAARRLDAVTVVDCGFSLEVDEELSYDTTAPRRNGATLEVLERADTVLAVGSADPVGLSRLIRGVHELQAMLPDRQPIVVLNKARASTWWPRDEIEAMLRRTTPVTEVAWLPLDLAACDRALLRGETLLEAAPTSKLSRAFVDLAGALSGESTGPRRRRFTSGRAARVR